jgi:hypothetical protein
VTQLKERRLRGERRSRLSGDVNWGECKQVRENFRRVVIRSKEKEKGKGKDGVSEN